MNRVVVGCWVVAVLSLAGCEDRPIREEFFAREAHCVRTYCTGTAEQAERSLLDCVRYAQRCQDARVEGIQYDEVFSRLYGRLYLIQRHLGHSQAAEQTLVKYAHYHAVRSTSARNSGGAYGEMVKLLEKKYDPGLHAAWKTNAPALVSHAPQAGR